MMLKTSEKNGSKISTKETYKMMSGTDSLMGRQEVDTSMFTQAMQLPVLTWQSHQLCVQLRLILERTNAYKLQLPAGTCQEREIFHFLKQVWTCYCKERN